MKPTFEIAFSHKAIAKIGKHSLYAYPLEAYGIFIGTTNPNFVFAALPVGKTINHGSTSGRFLDLEKALGVVWNLAKTLNMEVLGYYHSHVDEIMETPLINFPPSLRPKLVVIKKVSGGEFLFKDYFYLQSADGSWEGFEVKKISPKVQLPEFNQRHILSRWNKVWPTPKRYLSTEEES